MNNPTSTSNSSAKRPSSALALRSVSPPQSIAVPPSSSVEVTTRLLMTSRSEDASEPAAKRPRVASPPRNPFVSSTAVDGKSVWPSFCEWGVVPQGSSTVNQLTSPSSMQHSAAVTVDPAVATSTSATEPALDLPAISIIDSPSIADEWSQLSATTYMDAGRLDAGDRGFFSAPARSGVVCDADGNRLLVQYNSRDEVLPIMSVFAFVAQFSDRLDAQRFQYGFRLSGRAFKIRQGDDIRLSTAGGWLTRWLHWGGRGAVVCRCTSPYTDSPFIRMYEKVDYERRFSVMVDRYCRLLESGSLSKEELKVEIDLCCIDFPFDRAWFIQRPQYWMTDLDFELRARETFGNPSTRVLVDWHNDEVFAAPFQDRPVPYVGVESFEWSSFSSHRLLGVPTPPVLAYYSNLVLRPRGAQRHLIRVIALTEFAVCTVMRFLLAARDGVLSIHRHTTALQVGFPVILPVSLGVQEVVSQLRFLEIIRDSQLDAVAAPMAWKTMVALHWTELAKWDSVSFVYFNKDSLVGFHPDRDIPFIDDLRPIRSEVEKEVSMFYETPEADLGTVAVTPIVSGPISRSYTPPSPGVIPSRLVASLRLASAVVTVHSSSSQSVQAPMVSTTVAVASSIPSRPPSSSAVGTSSAPPLSNHADNISEDLRGPMELIREQRDAATRLAASRLADLESVRNDLSVASATGNGRNATVARLRSENSQLRGKVSRLTSEVGASQTLRAELDVFRQRLVDRDAEIDRLRRVVTSARDLLDDGLGGPDGQS